MDAAKFVRLRLAAAQEEGVTGVLFHTVMWQYLSGATREAITAAMEQAGLRLRAEKLLA